MKIIFPGLLLAALATNAYADNRIYSSAFQECKKTASNIDSQSRCVTNEIAEQKQRLNRVYRHLIEKLSKEQANSLERVQRNWITWRDGNYNFLAEQVPGEFSTTRVTSLNFLLNSIYDRAEELEMVTDEIGN